MCIVALTDNTSKYKEFIVTCNMTTHYIRPLMMKISSEICHNYYKNKLTTTRFYCFINGTIQNKPEKPWIIDINLAKNGQFYVFPQQAANSMANSEFRSTAWKSACRGILLALLIRFSVSYSRTVLHATDPHQLLLGKAIRYGWDFITYHVSKKF